MAVVAVVAGEVKVVGSVGVVGRAIGLGVAGA